jgi:hypothetical protein
MQPCHKCLDERKHNTFIFPHLQYTSTLLAILKIMLNYRGHDHRLCIHLPEKIYTNTVTLNPKQNGASKRSAFLATDTVSDARCGSGLIKMSNSITNSIT